MKKDWKLWAMIAAGLGLVAYARSANAAPRVAPSSPSSDAGWEWLTTLAPKAPPKSDVQLGRYMVANGRCYDLEDHAYVDDAYCSDLKGIPW